MVFLVRWTSSLLGFLGESNQHNSVVIISVVISLLSVRLVMLLATWVEALRKLLLRWIVNLSLYLVLITFKMPPTLFIRIANTLLAFDMLPYLWKSTRFIGDWNYKLLKIDIYLWLIRSILCIIDVEREWARGSQCQVGKDDNLKRKQMKRWKPEKKTNEKFFIRKLRLS